MSVINADSSRAFLMNSRQNSRAEPSRRGRVGLEIDSGSVWSSRPGIARGPRSEALRVPADGGRGSRWDDQFAEVVGPQLARLRRLARRILRSDDLADDAVQEALLSLWQEGRLPPNPDGWLVRAVVHRSLHLNRTRRKRRENEERASRRRSEHDPVGDASRPLEAAEVARAIEAALAELPDSLRVSFVLREAEQMDYESIAEVLRIPVGTVRSRLHRAREALKDTLRTSARA